MVDTRESLVIDVSLKDSVTAVLPQIKQAITAMADEASKALAEPGDELKKSLDQATKSLGGSAGLEDLKRQFDAIRSNVDQLSVSVSGLRTLQAELSSAGTAAVDAYIDALKRQSAAQTLTNAERAEAVALIQAERVAAQEGGSPSDSQRQAIVEEMRAREQLSAQRKKDADTSAATAALEAELARETRRYWDQRRAEWEATKSAKASLDAYLESLRSERDLVAASASDRTSVAAQRTAENLAMQAGISDRKQVVDLVRREIEETQRLQGLLSAQKAFESEANKRAQDLNRSAVSQGNDSRARELAELKAAILGREAEAEAQRKGKAALDQYVGSIRDERVLLALDAREREIVLAQRRAEQLALKAGIVDREKMLALVRQEVTANQQARQAALGQGGGVNFGAVHGVVGLLGGGQISAVAAQAQQGASALQQMGNSAELSAGQMALLGAAGAGIALLVSQLTDAAKEALDLEHALAPIAALSAGGAGELERVGASVRQIAVESGRSRQEVADLARVAAESNLEGNFELLRAAAQAANAQLGTSPQAFKAIKDVLDTFQLEKTAANFTAVADSVVAVSSALGVNREELLRATVQAGRLASQYGVSFQAVEVLVAKVASRTGDFGGAANAVSNVIRRLADENDDLHKTFALLGVDLSENAFRGDRFVQTITTIGDLVEKDSTLRQRATQGDRNAAAVLELLATRVNELRDAMTGAAQASGESAAAEAQFLSTTDQKIQRGLTTLKEWRNSALETATNWKQSLETLGDPSKSIGDRILLGLKTIIPPAFIIDKIVQVSSTPSSEATEAAKAQGVALGAQVSKSAEQHAKDVAPVLHFTVDSTGAINRSIDEAIAKLSAPFVRLDLRVFPEDVNKALEFIVKKPLRPGQAISAEDRAEIEAAVQALTRYGATAAQASDLVDQLNARSLSGFARTRAEQESVIRQYQRQIELIRITLPEVARAADEALQRFKASQDSEAAIAQGRALASIQADQLAATLEMLKASEASARAVGDVNLAETVGVAIRRESETLELRRLAIQEAADLQAQKGNSIEQDAIRARYESLRRTLGIQRETTEEVRRRAQAERTADSQRAIAGVRVSLGTGLQGEIARIRQAGEAEREAARAALEKLRTEAGASAQDVQNKVAETAAIVEGSFARQRRAEEEVNRSARADVAGELLRLEESVARTYSEQLAIIVQQSDAERERVRLVLVSKAAADDEIRKAEQLLNLAEQRRIIEAAIQDAGKSPVQRGEENLQNEAIRRTTMLLGEGKEATREWGEEFRRQIEQVYASNQALNEGIGAGIEQMRREFANNYALGVKAASDALRTFHDSGVQNLEDVLDGTKSLSDGLKGLAADFLKSIRHSMLDGLMNQLGGGLAGILGGLFGGGYQLPGTLIGAPYAQGGVVSGATVPVYQAAQGMVARSRTRLDVAEIPGLQELIAPLVGGRLPVHVDEQGGMRVRVRGADVPVDLQGAGTRRRADAAMFASGARERSGSDTRGPTRNERQGGSPVTIAPGAVVVHNNITMPTIVQTSAGRAGQDLSAQMPTIAKGIAADIERGATKALRDAIRAAAR